MRDILLFVEAVALILRVYRYISNGMGCGQRDLFWGSKGASYLIVFSIRMICSIFV